jgi:hypothetical protein
MFEANAEKAAAVETMAIIEAFCLEVKMLYWIAGDVEIVCSPFASSAFFFSILTAEKGYATRTDLRC